MRLLFGVVLCLVLAGPAVATRQPASASGRLTAEDILKVATISVLDVSDDGARVAATVRRQFDNAEVDHRRFGDPTYAMPSRSELLVIDTRDGETVRPFRELVTVRAAEWSHDGMRLAIVTAADPPAAAGPPTRLHVWDAGRAVLTQVPRRGEAYVSPASSLEWSADDRRLLVALRSPVRDREAMQSFRAVTEGPIVVHSSKVPFLEWDALRRGDRLRRLADIDVATGATTEVLAETRIASYDQGRDGSFVTFMEDVTEKTDYDVIFGSTTTLRAMSRADGQIRTVAEGRDLKGVQLRWSDDGRRFAYAKKGEVFVQGIDETTPRSLTPEAAEQKDAGTEKPPAPAEAKDEKESFSVGPFSRDASRVLITSRKGWYVADVATGARQQIVTLDEDEERNPRMEAIDWSPDGRFIYATWSERTRWERGLVRLDVTTRAIVPIAKDQNVYGGVRLSRDGSTFVYTMSDGDRPAELYVSRGDGAPATRLTDLNPWLSGKALPRSELVAYRDVDGKLLHGVLRYPIGYVKGTTYPTIFEIYETFFDNGFNGRAAFLTSHGYAVFHPSVHLVIGRPGEAWVKGVTSAANRLIEMGIADPDRLGVHGTSYGGYATALLITQTNRFKAAINISGKVNMVSFYTDSPRLGVRNTHAPEKSQDRIGGTLWEYPERYLEHSAILRADRIETPLLCITGDQDPNVPASQSREMYYALRRLGKEVEWVRYVNGGHRPPNSVAESVDFEQRILAWYDKYLKKAPARKETEAADRGGR
jgi:dipeptidyl aminopeptidase/acylaminoacyl peptidase